MFFSGSENYLELPRSVWPKISIKPKRAIDAAQCKIINLLKTFKCFIIF